MLSVKHRGNLTSSTGCNCLIQRQTYFIPVITHTTNHSVTKSTRNSHIVISHSRYRIGFICCLNKQYTHTLTHTYIYIFEVKLTFEMLTVGGQHRSFLTRTGVLVKVSKFWDTKCLDLMGTRTPNLRIDAECSNLLSYHGQTFAVPYNIYTYPLNVQIWLSRVMYLDYVTVAN